MTLDDAYRRRLRAFPKAWRAENEDELVAVLVDVAGEGATSVSLRETVDLLVGGLNVRAHRWRRRWCAQVAVMVVSVGVLAVAVAAASLGDAGSLSAEFLATSMVVVLIPGTGVVYTVSSAIGGGWQRGFVAAIGCTLGIVPHMAAAMVGLSGAMQAGATIFEVVRWAGVAYLVVMGVSMIRDGGALIVADDSGVGDQGAITIVRRGILLNVLNPKLTVFFFAFLPQFLDSTPTLVDPRLILLGGVFMAMTLVVFVGYASASAAVRRRVLDSPATVRWLQRALGTLLVGFAARLAVAER